MSGIQAPIGILGLILPIYTIIDMIETAENVWSDSCVCAMVDQSLAENSQPSPESCPEAGRGNQTISASLAISHSERMFSRR